MYSEIKASLRGLAARACIRIDKKQNGISTKGMSSLVITGTPCPIGGCALFVPYPCYPKS